MKRCFVFLIILLSACGTALPPDRAIPLVRLRGSAEEMGRQHGAYLAADIKTLYVRFLAAQVLPYLNRQHQSVSKTFLGRYTQGKDKDKYADGKFSYQFLLDSAESLKKEQPPEYMQELHGIALGSGMPEEQILVLNTFGDTLLGLLALSMYQEREKGPVLTQVEFPELIDGIDNDYDGVVDEVDENIVYYQPATQAALKRVPGGKLRLTLVDQDGVDMGHLQLQINGVKIENVHYTTDGTETTLDLDVSKLWREDWNTIFLQASDKTEVSDPLPSRPHTMRAARITVGGTKASGRATNGGIYDPPGAATSFAIVKEDASVMARNFVLLDGNTAHDHTAVFVYEPTPYKGNAKPQRYSTVGWAGTGWALTGMNEAGQAVSVNITETLDNGVARGIDTLSAPKAVGMTFGAVGRMVLAHNYTPDEFIEALSTVHAAAGFIVQLADATRKTVTTCELRAGHNLPTSLCYSNGITSPAFRFNDDYTGSLSAYRAFQDDAEGDVLGGALKLVPQRFWSTEWLQSYSTYARLQLLLGKDTPGNASEWIQLMRKPGIASVRNSMQSAILYPGKEMWVGVGRLPSTESQFERFTVKELFP